MTKYLGIDPLQEPFDLGEDEQGRRRCGFNVLAWKRPSTTFLAEITSILVDAHVVEAEGTDLFATPGSPLPDGPDPIVVITPTGGTGPVGTHNDGIGAYRRPAAQIIVYAGSWSEAETKALAVYDALIAVRNLAVSA